mgnify:CR=1 FL=1
MIIIAKNKSELWDSISVALAGFLVTAHMPKGFVDVLIIVGTQLIALFCALNALWDIRRMGFLERSLAVCWFCVVVLTAPRSVSWAATIRGFADR